jgi:DNA adenine methylase
VPYGHNKNPEIVNWEHLKEVNRLVQGVDFEHLDFAEALTRVVEKGSFVYLDPPYAPENATSFVKYTETGFSLEQHTRLFNMVKGLEASWVMSNADVELVRNSFSADQPSNSACGRGCGPSVMIEGLVCRRAIHSKSPDAKAREVIISKK